MAEPIVSVKGLEHAYGSDSEDCGFRLGPLSFELPVGACLGVLGPNSAGKTTLLRLLSGHLAPSGGSVQVALRDPFGLPLGTGDRSVAFATEPPLYPDFLRVRTLQAAVRRNYRGRRTWRRKRAPVLDLAERWRLGHELRGRRIHELSTGQRQQLQLELTLATAPRLWLLDEPQHGLDHERRELLAHTLADYLVRDARAAVICTHVTGDLERLASHVLLLREGRAVLFGELGDVLDRAGKSLDALYQECCYDGGEAS